MIETTPPRFPWTAWALTSVVCLLLASAAWAWLDWRYVKELWTMDAMMRANGILAWILPIATLFVQYIVLRAQSPGRQTMGALTSAVGVTIVWWLLILTVGDWFHLKIGGVLQ